jgi:cytoskeletal protein CcmA (bactofilin family)
MGGVTFDAGVYHATTLSTAAADIITLRGGPSDIFIFQSASTLVIGANTQIKLIGGACADNVFWSLGSAATIGADSDFIGTVFAGSAITLGKDVVVRGRLFAQTTITFGATNTIYAGVCSATGTDDCAAGYKCGNDEDGFVCEDIDVAAITFDLPLDCSGFAVLAETAITFADTTIINDGNVGIGSGNIEAITGNFTGANSVPIVQQSSPVSASCKTAKQRAYDYTARTPGTKPATIAAGMGGVTFDAGVYHATTLSTAAADIITLRGGPSDIFIFQTDSTIVLGANTKIKLIGGACADNVFWSVGSAATIGADSDFIGTVFAGSAITLGADVVVRGRLYAQTAITFGATNTIEAESGFSGFCSSTAANSS